jgi:hypothetical protein
MNTKWDKDMSPKEHLQLDCTVCSGIQADVTNLKKSDEDQWDNLKGLQTSKASSSQMKWVIGLFLIISLAVVGFLWRTQVSGTDKIVTQIEGIKTQADTKREETNNRLDVLKDRVNELKWGLDEHMRKGGDKK